MTISIFEQEPRKEQLSEEKAVNIACWSVAIITVLAASAGILIMVFAK